MNDVFRQSGEIDHKNNFDLIRLFAALQVVQFHLFRVLSLPAKPNAITFILGQFPGVPIFFVVSGFLVTQSYRYGSGNIDSYFARRALRIYPALWINISLIVLLLAVTGSLSAQMEGPRLGEWLLVTFFMGSEIAGNFFVGLGVVLSFAFTWHNAASILRGNDLSYGIYLYHLPIIITLNLLGFSGRTIDWIIVGARCNSNLGLTDG
jgi:peptidoglycan/LPS O-acetylase OafA/YrhL